MKDVWAHEYHSHTFSRTYSPELKMRTYLRITQLALDYGNAVEAETFVNRASMLLNDISKPGELLVLFKVGIEILPPIPVTLKPKGPNTSS